MTRNGTGRGGRGAHTPAGAAAPTGLGRARPAAYILIALVAGLTGCTGASSSESGASPATGSGSRAPDDPAAGGPPTSAAGEGRGGGRGEGAGTPGPKRTAAEDVADPVRVRIPAIGVSTKVIALPLDASGRLVAPKRYDLAGWNKSGPEPGETGAAVVAAHVDSRTGPAVFFRLRELDPGDRVHVDRADGSTVTFTVRRLARYPKNGIPDKEVYAPSTHPELRLITCGGTFDQRRRSYRDNLIAFATRPA